MDHRDLLSGFIRLHILHHAVEGELYGQWMIEELACHGYRLSPGTLYPLLHGLEKKGYLASRKKREGKTIRKYYRATPLGRRPMKLARAKAPELFAKLFSPPRPSKT